MQLSCRDERSNDKNLPDFAGVARGAPDPPNHGESMRRTRMLLTSVLLLSLPLSSGLPAAALVQPAQTARAASMQLQEADGIPAAPIDVQTFPVIGGLGVAWAPAVEAGGVVESYLVQTQRSNGDWANASRALPASTTRWVDSHVKSGASATYRVLAVNSAGESLPSATAIGSRPATDPVIGTSDVLTVDADVASFLPTMFTDEVSGPVAQSSSAGVRTLSAGTVQITLPAIVSGPGTYAVGTGGQPFVLRQKDAECSVSGTLTIAELAYTADFQVATMSARFSGSCTGVSSVYGEIRVKSTQPYAALSIDTPRVDLGRVELGTAPRNVRVTMKNVGTTDLVVGIKPLPADPTWTFRDDFSCQQLVPGQSCSVVVTFTPDSPRDEVALMDIFDNTARATHHIRFSASVYTTPAIPDKLTVDATYSGVDLSWRANSWGNATPVGFVVERTVDGIETKFTVPPDQTHWTEPWAAASRPVTYRVSAVNEFFEGQPSVRVSPAHALEQVTVVAGPPGEPAALGGVAVPKATQVVPIENAPVGEGAEVTSAPNGVDVAYVIADGAQNGLWIRRLANGTNTLLRSAPGLAHPSWSPDGTRIAFSTTGIDSTTCVDILTLSDSSVVRVGCDLDYPIWHTDSHSLIVQDKGIAGSPLARVEAREQGTRLMTIEGSEGATRPALSPTGDWLAFVPQGSSDEVALLPPGGGTATVIDLGFVEAFITDFAWDTNGRRIAVITKSADRYLIQSFNAMDVLGGDSPNLGTPVYNTTSEQIADFTWQGHNVVIGETPLTIGPSVSIPFDTSALQGESVECYLDGESVGSCTSPFTATGLSNGTHTFQVLTTNSGVGDFAYSGWSTRTFTVQ
jgi:hypothetical protein